MAYTVANFRDAANDIAQHFSDVSDTFSDFSEVMDQVSDFASDLDVDAFNQPTTDFFQNLQNTPTPQPQPYIQLQLSLILQTYLICHLHPCHSV